MKYRVFAFVMLSVTAVWGWMVITGDPGALNAADNGAQHDGYYISELQGSE